MNSLQRNVTFALLFFLGSLAMPLAADDATSSVAQLAREVQPSIVTIHTDTRDGREKSIGTGFVIDAAGVIATNLHVVPEGRRFSVQLHDGTTLKAVAVEASDHTHDLALIRVEQPAEELRPLELAEADSLEQGADVVAFGNPLGLRGSVVRGVVSAIREVGDKEMIQLAIPVQPGNSGGPLVDREGRVHGIVNMKSAVDDNLGFAIPVGCLITLREQPNPVVIDRWIRLGSVDPKRWRVLGGGDWIERSGILAVSRPGDGFGGRTLCLSTVDTPELPFEIAVEVKLDDESGAAGLIWHSDGADRHYGFYPSAGNLRLSCFRGADVFSWQVLEETASPHYQPGQWNRLKVRVEPDQTLCFVNGHQVFQSRHRLLTEGRIGLAKFRDTSAQFRRFVYGAEVEVPQLEEAERARLLDAVAAARPFATVPNEEQERWLDRSEAAVMTLHRHAHQLRQEAKRAEQMVDDLRLMTTVAGLREVMQSNTADQLPRAALLIAKLDHPDLDVDVYLDRIERMADEVREMWDADAGDAARRAALDDYLFQQSGFHGGRVEYYHPANSHLNRVIDDREGLPITLSVLYMDLARRLGLKVEGIGLPGHFVARYVPQKGEPQLIDVFDRGKEWSRDDAVRTVLRFAGRALEESDLEPQSNRAILTRITRNLIGSSQGETDKEALRRYTEALVALEPENPQFRMMRVIILHQTDRDHQALQDLDWLLQRDNPGMDRGELQRMRDFLEQQLHSSK